MRFTLPQVDELVRDCLLVPGPVAIPQYARRQVWITPSDEELRRRNYPMRDLIDATISAGRFGDADCLFINAPEDESDVLYPCPWGQEVPRDEDRFENFAGALSLILRRYAPGVGAIALSDDRGNPGISGFVTYGTHLGPADRARALSAAYVAAGRFPPSAVALAALAGGPLPDGFDETVAAALRASIQDLGDRVEAARANLTTAPWPRP